MEAVCILCEVRAEFTWSVQINFSHEGFAIAETVSWRFRTADARAGFDARSVFVRVAVE